MRFHGFQIVPSSLVPIARGLLNTQGIDGSALDDQGNLDAAALIPAAFDTITLKTSMFPDIDMDLHGPPDPATAALLDRVRPVLVFKGRAGRYEFAPAGAPGNFWRELASPKVATVGWIIMAVLLIGGVAWTRRRVRRTR